MILNQVKILLWQNSHFHTSKDLKICFPWYFKSRKKHTCDRETGSPSKKTANGVTKTIGALKQSVHSEGAESLRETVISGTGVKNAESLGFIRVGALFCRTS